jgi:alkyl sulfatase BDS1-like metallo-beta-lactamase superfamily hydrolase
MYMNKPKCALFLNGCIRDSIENYCKCITNMLEIFSGEYDIDIYFHTWKSFNKTNTNNLLLQLHKSHTYIIHSHQYQS